MSSSPLTLPESNVTSSLKQFPNDLLDQSLSDLDRGVSALYVSASSSFLSGSSNMSHSGSLSDSQSLRRKVHHYPVDNALELISQMEMEFPKTLEKLPRTRAEPQVLQHRLAMIEEDLALLSIWPKIAKLMRDHPLEQFYPGESSARFHQ